MKTIVLQQKKERDDLLKLPYQTRTAESLAKTYLKSKPIKLITGPRRAGKSMLALHILEGEQFAYLNFDDSKLLEKFDEDAVEQALSEVYRDYEYLLLDEIQNLEGWSVWVEKLYRRGVNMVITGSNAKLLSDDLAAALTGRFLEIRLYPFSANEYLAGRNIGLGCDTPAETASANSALEDFSVYGGYPEAIDSKSIIPGYLSALYDSIIVKDIVKRYKVRKVEELYSVADWLLSNFTNPFSVSSLTEELELGSETTVQKFCTYLQNTYLFQYLPRFSSKLKLMKKADRKAYVIDNGFVFARAFELSRNSGRLLENLVFLELLKQGYDPRKYELFYYRSHNDREVDFVLRKGVTVKGLIQVCYDLSSKKTRAREIKALLECGQELKNENLTIITWNESGTVEEAGHTVRIVPLREWIAANRS
jgi:uncharacterized protein